METTFVITNKNKRVAHVWFTSQLGEGFTATVPTSPASDQEYQFNLPEVEMPKYSKYTIKVNKFCLLPNYVYDPAAIAYGMEPLPANASPIMVLNGPLSTQGIPAGVNINSFGCFVEMTGDPFELNYIPNGDAVALGLGPGQGLGRGVEQTGRVLCGFDATAVGNGLCALTTYENPKIVVSNGILGHNSVRIKIIDQAYFETVVGDVERGGNPIRPLPPWTMCLEIEGIDGFEEFDMPAPQPKPIPTGGINTMFQSGFHDSNKYGGGGNGQVGY
jgi:hypothetical protein